MSRLILCLVLIPGVVWAVERQPATSGAEFVPGWLLVRLERPLEEKALDGTFSPLTPIPALNALIEERGILKIEHALPGSTRHPRSPVSLSRHGLDRVYKFRVPEGTDIMELVEKLSDVPGVEWAEPDYIRRPAAVIPDDPRFPDQWGLNQTSDADVDAPEAWEIATGADVVVAVIDTGVDMSHEDLVANLVDGCGLPGGPCWDFVDGDFIPQDNPGGVFSGHGTNVASIIGGSTDNGVGVAGACWGCFLMPLRVWDQHGNFGTASMVADAVVWAADHGARVINYSGGGYNVSQTELSGASYAADAGVIYVSITHNDGIASVTYPGRFSETIAVGATNQLDQRAGFSNYGPEIDVVAPGVSILSADMDDTYLVWSGTSYAAPFVSGLTGIMRSMNPSIGRQEARHLVHSGAEDEVGDPSEDTAGFDDYHGHGRINMQRTLAATASSTTLRVEGKESTRAFLDSPNPVADSYDFVRGDLASLSESAMGVGLGRVLCLENDSSDADTVGGNEDEDDPLAGEGYFYVARFNAAPGAGSHGGSSRNRDRFVADWAWAAEGDQAGARFGFAVDSAGDVNNDGHDDVIIGAYFRDDDQVDEGAAFVYHGSPDGLGALPVWSGHGNQTSAWFGTSVGSAGDVNGDGHDDVIVGAPNHDNGHSDEGRAYVYLGSASGLESTWAWIAEGGQANAALGFRVGTAGDVNDDGYDDVIVAARRYAAGQSNEGRAYVYHGSAAGLSTTPDWTFETNQAEAQVTAVATAGDVDCDGYDDVVVGSRKFDNGEIDEGRVFVFYGSDSGLSTLRRAILEIDVVGAEFGFAAATAGNVDGIGCDDLIVGAHLYSNGEDAEGGAFVYLGSPEGLSTTPAWSFESDKAETRAGQSAKTAGDVNGDGYDDVIVGGGSFGQLLSYHNDSRTDEGQAWLFLGSGSGLSTTPVWSDVGRQTSAFYGWAAAPAGNVNGDGYDDIIVGAYGHDNDEVNEGRAYVFHGPVISSDCGSESP